MLRIPSKAAVVIAATAAANAAAAPAPQQALWQQYGEVRYERFGESIAWLDDLDGDGVRDFAAGAPAWDAPFLPRYGLVRICSGVDGALLSELREDDRHSFGWRVANAGDLDSDGHDDLLIGAPDDGDGFVFAFGSVSGAKLYEIPAPVSSKGLSRYGHGLVSLGDADGDGVPDFVVGAPDHWVGNKRTGLVELHSGWTGALLFSFTAGRDSNFGDCYQIDATGDLDGDGLGDLVTLELLLVPNGTPNCNVDFWSGATLTRFRRTVITVPNTGYSNQFHHPTVRVAGDVDGDGVVDLVISMDDRGATPSSRAIFVSGATGAEFRTILSTNRAWGARCGGVGDLDGDGLAEVAVTTDTIQYGHADLEIFKGSDGSLLRTIQSDRWLSHAFASSFDGTVDADGDGIHDLLVGSPPYYEPAYNYLGGPGHVQRRSLLDGSTFFVRVGVTVLRDFLGAAALVDDVDGDGVIDLVTPTIDAVTSFYVPPTQRLTLRAGSDGSEIVVTPPPLAGDFSGEILAIPDVDGDGFVDIVVAPDDNSSGHVDVHSGVTLQVVRSLPLTLQASYLLVLAAGVQPATGNVEVCVGAPTVGLVDIGAVTLFDAVTGVKRWEVPGDATYAYEAFGSAVAFVGDIDGDGWSDWAVGAPGNGTNGQYCGCVRFLSGFDGTLLHTLFGPTTGYVMGSKLAALPDSGGDGVAELLVKSYRYKAGGKGQLDLLDSATWTPIASIQGTTALEDFPYGIVAPLPDANGDGFPDFALRALYNSGAGDRYELRSGRDARLLHRRYFRPGDSDFWRQAVGPPPGQTGVRRKGGGPVMVAWDTANSVYGDFAGMFELLELDDLYLEIEPPSAPAGATVEAFVRGGPPGALAAVMLESINGIPIGLMLAVSVLDANGELALDAVIPPGLSGDEWSLLGFAIGWNGKLVASQSAEFAFE